MRKEGLSWENYVSVYCTDGAGARKLGRTSSQNSTGFSKQQLQWLTSQNPSQCIPECLPSVKAV